MASLPSATASAIGICKPDQTAVSVSLRSSHSASCFYTTADLRSNGLASSTVRDATGPTSTHFIYTQSVFIATLQDTGEVVRAWGDGQLAMPHGLAVDARSGEVWVTDVGRHQVGSGSWYRVLFDRCSCFELHHVVL